MTGIATDNMYAFLYAAFMGHFIFIKQTKHYLTADT